MAILKIGVPIDRSNKKTIEILTAALSRLPDRSSFGADSSLSYARADVESFVESPENSVRLIGIRLLAWVVEDEVYVRDTLVKFIHSGAREERVAALTSLRINDKAPKILTRDQGEALWQFMEPDKSRDIRVATARLLATIAGNDVSFPAAAAARPSDRAASVMRTS